jgi:hypothetical protein
MTFDCHSFAATSVHVPHSTHMSKAINQKNPDADDDDAVVLAIESSIKRTLFGALINVKPHLCPFTPAVQITFKATDSKVSKVRPR